MGRVTGTVGSYNQETGEGLIVLDGEEEPVRVDLESSAGIRLENGLRVQCARIHRPTGVFASDIKII